MTDKKTILVVEDSPTQRENLRGLLADAGYNVFQAPNGVEAYKIARQVQPDLVLSDIEMPEMDGYTLCSTIARTPQLAHIPVILFSSLDHIESLRTGYAAGARDFLSKREDNEDRILATVRVNLGEKELEQELVARETPKMEESPFPAVWSLGALEHLGVGIAAVDLRRTLVYANRRARSWFGLSSDARPESADRLSIETLLVLAFETITNNASNIVHPIVWEGRALSVRAEEILDEHQEICGLLLLMWAPE